MGFLIRQYQKPICKLKLYFGYFFISIFKLMNPLRTIFIIKYVTNVCTVLPVVKFPVSHGVPQIPAGHILSRGNTVHF